MESIAEVAGHRQYLEKGSTLQDPEYASKQKPLHGIGSLIIKIHKIHRSRNLG